MEETMNVSEYIKIVNNFISKKSDNCTIVYRGENQIYDTPCLPNLFRNNALIKNEFFEKSLFDEMTANKLTEGNCYLEKAIDAQHGGFPSRLLDISYNCLVALYFATTPYFYYSETTDDDKDGVVYIYFIEKLFCPSGKNINDTYDAIVNRDKKNDWIIRNIIFQKNHKLIDHIKTNKRIIAQQGAFILFQGDDMSPMPESDFKKIIIPSKSKQKIRKDLKLFFGIHTGSIYPEASNLVNDITSKSYKVNNSEFNVENEINLIMFNLRRELEFYSSEIVKELYKKRHKNNDLIINEIVQKIIKVEEQIYSYKDGLEKFIEETEKTSSSIDIKKIINQYNSLIDEFDVSLSYHIKEYGIEFSREYLIIEERKAKEK